MWRLNCSASQANLQVRRSYWLGTKIIWLLVSCDPKLRRDAVLLVEDKSTVLNNSFYLSIIAVSVDDQNLNYRVVLVSERQMLMIVSKDSVTVVIFFLT